MIIRNRILTLAVMLMLPAGICHSTECFRNTVSLNGTIHDFGTISIKEGPKTCSFKLTNISGTPLRITEIVTSCGCTEAKWEKAPIAPEETAVIEVTYDNKEVSNLFDKRVAVHFEGIEEPLMLGIRGSSTDGSRRGSYRYRCSSLKFEKESYYAGEVHHSDAVHGELTAVYCGLRPSRIILNSSSDRLVLDCSEFDAHRGDTLRIGYTVKAKETDFGRVNCFISSSKAGKPSRRHVRLWARACADYRAAGTEGGPSLATDRKQYAAGNIKSGSKGGFEIRISNNGDEELIIYKIDSEHISAASEGSFSFKPGESRNISLTLDSGHLDAGKHAEAVTIYSNDTIFPEYNFYVTYNVEQNTFLARLFHNHTHHWRPSQATPISTPK